LLRVVKTDADAGDVAAKRDYAMLRFYFATGKRREEIVQLQWGDVRIQRDFIVITAKHKGGIYSASEIRDAVVRAALMNYLQASGRWNKLEQSPQLEESDRLWLRHDNAANGNQALTSHGFAKAVKRYAERAGIPHFHLHQTRHTVARMVGEESGSLADVQTVLGHQNQATTRVYLQRVAVKRDHYSESIGSRLDSDTE